MTSTGDTPREAQVLEQLMLGKSYADVATALKMAKSTVEHHTERLRRRRYVDTVHQLRAHVWNQRQDEWRAKEAAYIAEITALRASLDRVGRRASDRAAP